MPDLVIVESPGKTRKINGILGRGFVVRASFGHVRDLPQPPSKRSGASSGNARSRPRQQVSLGLDVDAGWKPTWEIIDSKSKVVRELQGLGRNGTVYLATDLDREGEAIAWHLRELLGGSEERFRRVTFSEITPAAVQAAFERPRGIDYDLVHAQQARRFLDRVVGFTVSPLLSRRLRAGLSAGRVQSAALRILVERDEKIRVFRPAEFFAVDLPLSIDDGEPVTAQVVDVDGNVARFDQRSDAEALAAHLASVAVTLDDVATVDASQNPKPPFTTSTLQQAASSLLKLSVSDVMAIAQKLYEAGRITYMRSDAVFVAPEAQAAAREWLTAAFGEGAVPGQAPQYKSKAGAQEAHEAIRPTNPAAGPEGLEPEQAKVYDLVRRRLLASQMMPARIRRTTWKLSAPGASGAAPVRLVATGRVVVDPGFHRVLPPASAADEPPAVPDLAAGTVWASGSAAAEVSSSWTKPPPRYTEASLVAELESAGVGRPSTYANTLKTLVDRLYVLLDGRVFVVTPLGRLVCARLSRHFPKVTDVGFTAALEKSLDEVATGWAGMHGLLDAFYGELKGGRAARGEAAQGLGRRRGRWTGFPSRRGHPIGDDKLSALVRPLGIAAVRPGFGSSLRNWASERTDDRREVIEAALADVSAQVVAAADPPGASRPLCPMTTVRMVMTPQTSSSRCRWNWRTAIDLEDAPPGRGQAKLRGNLGRVSGEREPGPESASKIHAVLSRV